MNFQVILTSPTWRLNGVNVFSANLIGGLRNNGVPAKLLLTRTGAVNWNPMELPTDIPIERLPAASFRDSGARRTALIDYLEENAPCIYIPNYDYDTSCVSSILSSRIGIVGIVHSDDPEHYEHVGRLGRYWNAVVAVSTTIASETARRNPALSGKIESIPYGVPVPDTMPERSFEPGLPLRLVYSGRLVQYQKRVLDLVKIAEVLERMRVPFRLTVIGDGEERERLESALSDMVQRGQVQFLGALAYEQVLEQYRQQDIFIMTSEFEGMPIALLEAMSLGCLPVVFHTRSGIPELIQDGINGYRIRIRDISTLAEKLAFLYRNTDARQQMAQNAYLTVRHSGYRLADMTTRYVALFQRIMHEIELGHYSRPYREIMPPSILRAGWGKRLPHAIRNLGFYYRTWRKQRNNRVLV
ncbi:MAG: glycosyltransferase family 4 protein [Candidatus Omnitrophota bacterium]|nr:glycosyltransferase family 4 protein [Candidatus Omnitrophota bacterium]